MLQASFKKYQLKFNHPVLTSRGEMRVKNGYYLLVSDGGNTGIGECSFIENLSPDDLQNYEATLQQICQGLQNEGDLPDLYRFPSIKFGMETALHDLANGGKKILFPGPFIEGKRQIAINGLVWMGGKDFMMRQIQSKLEDGFKCIKIKVAAIDFEEELILIDYIRQKFPKELIEIRLDANGGFSHNDVFQKLEKLSKYQIHSIEQPVKQGQLSLMEKICRNTPIPVALDEELISPGDIGKEDLLAAIRPQYVILKPSLLGGFKECDEWIKAAEQLEIKWWATSALESNIGLNAIAQWVLTKSNNMIQGLGTGGLYASNISSPLYMAQGHLGYNPDTPWGSV